MTYNQAKILTISFGVLICVSIYILIILNMNNIFIGNIIASGLFTLVSGIMLGLLIWVTVSVIYLQALLDKSTLIESDIEVIWRESYRYRFYKEMNYQLLIDDINELTKLSSNKVIGNKKDIHAVATACICIHYTNLWCNRYFGNDPKINELIKSFNDQIEMVKRFR